MSQQQVLCLPRGAIENHVGFTPWDSSDWLFQAAADNMTWLPRDMAEVSSDFVQPIPCALVVGPKQSYRVFQRIESGRPDLASRISMIIGGHIDWVTGNQGFGELVAATLLREIGEELDAESPKSTKPIGLVIDGETLESSRHIGIVHEVEFEGLVRPIAPEEFSSRSTYAGLPRSTAQLMQLRDQLDPWSTIIVSEYLTNDLALPNQPRLL